MGRGRDPGLTNLSYVIQPGGLRNAVGIVLGVTMCAALFSVGAALWLQCRRSHAAAIAVWQRVFRLACGVAVGLMFLILAVTIVPLL